MSKMAIFMAGVVEEGLGGSAYTPACLLAPVSGALGWSIRQCTRRAIMIEM